MTRRQLGTFLASFSIATGLIVGAFAIFSHSYFLVTVRGESMTPTLQDGDQLLLKKTPEGEVGEYVTFGLPEGWKTRWLGDDETTLIKRVALGPGDKLSWDGTSWSRNGEVFSSISSGTCPIKPLEYELEEGEYFVTGDTSTSQTMDSREAFCFDLGFVVEEEQVENFGRIAHKF